jgi:hypothetical protein
MDCHCDIQWSKQFLSEEVLQAISTIENESVSDETGRTSISTVVRPAVDNGMTMDTQLNSETSQTQFNAHNKTDFA